ncbi:Signal transduction histidine kinase [Faunimonas pinastri]|uniref:histidine kinase n=2 Tax=Faunimonas pinastri TaxID=1855383 RepID=A0A1H9KZU8_9HYPH|nr:Signal transduction histidine kinase [Faunimonas pinastri]
MVDIGRPHHPRLRLFRTTAFKLSVIYFAVFSVFAAFLIGYIASSTTQLLTSQMREAVDTELKGLEDEYRQGGIPRLALVIDRRSRQPGASLYLIADANGDKIAGNVSAVPESVLNGVRTGVQTVPYARLDEGDRSGSHSALVRVVELPGGFRMLVGRDIGERDYLAHVIKRALILTLGMMVVLGLASWLFVSRRVLRRIDSMSETSRTIIAGDLSRRLEVTGTRDEFDRLAESVNAMLVRIERLMVGLKEVSDNIAHDLKTPLSRLRSRAEAALAQGGGEAAYREALQAAIEDADQLIRTFNALLMIARVEAGSSNAEFDRIPLGTIAGDIFELYEPLAEEAGVDLRLEDCPAVEIRANRELVSQALANLVDNAIKYAHEAGGEPKVSITVRQDRGRVEMVVADNGSGIPAEDRERVTQRFVRLEKSRSKPGAGLGLSLVSAVAQLHGGSLKLEDNQPGLRAIVSFPAGDAVADA